DGEDDFALTHPGAFPPGEPRVKGVTHPVPRHVLQPRMHPELVATCTPRMAGCELETAIVIDQTHRAAHPFAVETRYHDHPLSHRMIQGNTEVDAQRKRHTWADFPEAPT